MKILIRLTISIEDNLSDSMRLIDVNGAPHVLTEHQVWVMITIGWISFLAAWLMNLLNYKVHPSSVNFNTKEKMFIYIFGKKYNLRCIFYRSGCCAKGEGTLQLLYANDIVFHPQATRKIMIWEKILLWKIQSPPHSLQERMLCKG